MQSKFKVEITNCQQCKWSDDHEGLGMQGVLLCGNPRTELGRIVLQKPYDVPSWCVLAVKIDSEQVVPNLLGEEENSRLSD